MRTSIIFAVAFSTACSTLIAPLGATAGVIAGPVRNPANGHRYYLLSPSSWTASESEAVALGGHLVTINNDAENNFVFETFSAGTRVLWIGLNDAAEEGVFVWVSGQPVTYVRFFPGEPNNSGGGEDYVQMLHFTPFWNDIHNSRSGYGVVEVECGDWEVEGIEECDEGELNGTTDSCCAADCTFVAVGDSCNDGNACTQTDECDGAGICVGDDPVVCTPLDQCHDTGTCDPGSGVCDDPEKPAGDSCNDGNECTQTDECDGAGICVGGDPVVCAPLDQCHDTGTCDPGSGICDDPEKPNGTVCDDANDCTLDDTCQMGTCVPGEPTLLNPLADPNQTLECVEQTVGSLP